MVPEKRDEGLTVEVFGNSFTFKNVGSPAQLHDAAVLVESRMKELSQKWRIVSPAKLAIMAALEMCIELTELSENAERGKKVARSILESLDQNLPEPAEENGTVDDDEPFLLT